MRVIVIGSRHFSNHELMDSVLSDYDISVIISGGAKGADKLAAEYAIKNKIELIEFHANWKKYGNSAGPIRNKKMIRDSNADLVIAFNPRKGTNS